MSGENLKSSCEESEGGVGGSCSYDAEVNALHQPIRQAVTLLLEDHNNSVKQVSLFRLKPGGVKDNNILLP